MFDFDYLKWQDEYMKLLSVHFKPESTFSSVLKETASRLIKESLNVYNIVVRDLVRVGMVDALNVKNHSDPRFYERITEELKTAADDEQKAKLNEMLERITDRFKEDTNAYDATMSKLIRSIESSSADLRKSSREDLSEIGFQAQLKKTCTNCLKNIGEFSQYIQTCFVEPIKKIQDEIKELDEKIERKLDPENIIKNFKTFLPTEKEVSELIENGSKSEAAAEMEGIKLLYSTALKAIDVIGDVMLLCKDINKRAALYNSLNKLKDNYEEASNKRQVMLDEYDEVLNLAVLNKLMAFYLDGADKASAYMKEIRAKLNGFAKATDIKGYYNAISEFIADIEASQL